MPTNKGIAICGPAWAIDSKIKLGTWVPALIKPCSSAILCISLAVKVGILFISSAAAFALAVAINLSRSSTSAIAISRPA